MHKVFFYFLLFAHSSFAADYLLFEENGRYGLKDDDGKIVINAAFEGLGWSDGSFSVIGEVTGYKLNQKWGLINLKEQRVTNADYLSLLPSGGDRFIVKKSLDAVTTKMGCIDLKGSVTVPFKYDGIKISGLRAIVFVKNGHEFKYGVVTLNGDLVIPPVYKNIFSLNNLRYAVQNQESKTALFSEAGTRLTEFYIDSISSFIKNRATIYEGYQQGIINRDGIIEVKPQYREIKIGPDDVIKARAMTKWSIINAENLVMNATACDDLIPNPLGFSARIVGQFGIWDHQFNPIIPASYSKIVQVRGDRIVAKIGDRFGLIQSDNSILIPFQYDSIAMDERFVRVKNQLLGRASWQLFDIYGIKKSEKSYEYISPFNGKFFIVKNYERSGLVDRYGKETVHCLYDSIMNFQNDQLVVKFHGHYGIIDFKENWLLPPQPYPVQLVDEEHYIINQSGTTHFKTFNGELIYFTDNKLSVDDHKLKEFLPDGTEKEISFDGITLKRTTPPKIDDTEIISAEHEGLRGIRRNGKYGFIDNEGRLRIANRYEDISYFKDGLAAVKILGKWGFINAQDKIVINPSYDWVSEFSSGIAIARRGKYGLLNQQGEIVLENRYDSIKLLHTANFLIFNDGLVGLASMKGDVLIDPKFDALQDIENGYLVVSRGGKYGVLKEYGLSAIPMVYDQIVYLQDSHQFLAKQEEPWITVKVN